LTSYKPGYKPKSIKKSINFFAAAVTFLFAVTKRLNIFVRNQKIYYPWCKICHCDSSERLVFWITALHGASKKTNFKTFISQAVRVTIRFVLCVGKPCVYRKHCLDVTPTDLELRYRGYRGVKFPTFATPPFTG